MPLIQRVLGAVLALLFLLAALVFASILFTIAVGTALALWAWLWWRGRSLPRRHTIEGEYRDVTDLERLQDRGRGRL